MPKFVPNGQGKGWARGRTAATDPRIARNAQAHRGKTYTRRVPWDLDRRCRTAAGPGIRTLPLEWSDTMAYVVGLMATDGCLISDGRHLNFKSEDEQLVRTFLECLGRPMSYSRVRTRIGNAVYVAQFGDVRFYDWLMTIGLMPRKSLILGGIDVPDAFLCPTLRGLLDGDGHISNFVHRPTPSTYPDYAYERFWVFFNSGSRRHVEWIAHRVRDKLGLNGYIETQRPRDRNEFFRVKFGKRDSVKLLQALYPREDVPKLERKWELWRTYAERHFLSATVPTAGLEPA